MYELSSSSKVKLAGSFSMKLGEEQDPSSFIIKLIMESSIPTYQDKMSCYLIVEDQTSGVSSLDTMLPVLFLHGWLRTTVIDHFLSEI
jgi:hypothetical protein